MTRLTHCYALLKVYVNSQNQELIELYKNHIEKHNESMKNDKYSNSGFDIFVPDTVTFNENYTPKMIDMQIKTEMTYWDHLSNSSPSAFLLYPRSSISKTELMLANHTGIIDCGYRGWIMGAFRWLSGNSSKWYTVSKHTRLLQICHPSLCPIVVELVEDESELTNTERGEGGFGSTGIVGVSK